MAGRKKLDRTNLHARVAPGTGDKLKEVAYKLGYIYDGEGSAGQLLDAYRQVSEAIVNGELILISTKNRIEFSKSGYKYYVNVV